MARAELTRRIVAELAVPTGGKVRVYDTRIPGFCVEVLRSGRKTFWLRYGAGRRRSREIKLGTYGQITVDQARDRALMRRAEVTAGADPALERDRCRAALTFGEFVEGRFLPHVQGRLACAGDYATMLRLRLVPAFGRDRLAEVTAQDVERFRSKLLRSGLSNGRINRHLSLLRRCFGLAIQWGLRPGPNPAQAPGMLPEAAREFFLDAAQMRALLAALAADRDLVSAGAIALMLVTGARRSEVLNARWEHLDLQRRVLLVPRSKAGRRHFVTLSDAAVKLLQLQPRPEGASYVFPSARKPDRPLTSVRAAWERTKKAAGLPPAFRLHDLRHTYASCLINSGASLYDVSKLLGHRNIDTSQRYAHLSQDRLLSAANAVGRIATDAGPAVGATSNQ